ncbi:MAG: hypothetical protein Pars2KO_32540 [Parasphingorhabdus sp.]
MAVGSAGMGGALARRFAAEKHHVLVAGRTLEKIQETADAINTAGGSAKAALRNLAQALAREYGPQGIRVGHVVIDGAVNGDNVRGRFGEYLEMLGEDGSLNPDAITEAFLTLHLQTRSAWTHELDIRPFKENW